MFFRTALHMLLILFSIFISVTLPEKIAYAAISLPTCVAYRENNLISYSIHSTSDANILCSIQAGSFKPLNQSDTHSKCETKETRDQLLDWNAIIRDIAWPATILFITLLLRRRIPDLIEKFFIVLKRLSIKIQN